MNDWGQAFPALQRRSDPGGCGASLFDSVASPKERARNAGLALDCLPQSEVRI